MPASSRVHGAAVGDGRQDACLLPPEHSMPPSEVELVCNLDMPLAPLGCAPITIPHAKSDWVGSLLPGSAGNPAELRVWTPATPRDARRPGAPAAASQASSVSRSAETPAGVRVGTPAWSAWRRRRDLLRASSQESGTSAAETPAGSAEGAPAWQLNHDLCRAARVPADPAQHCDLTEAGRLNEDGTLKRTHYEADTLPAAAPQEAGMGQNSTGFLDNKGMLVSATPSSHAMARCMSCLRTGGNLC